MFAWCLCCDLVVRTWKSFAVNLHQLWGLLYMSCCTVSIIFWYYCNQFYFASSRGSKVLWWPCLSVCPWAYFQKYMLDLYQFFWLLPMATAQSSSNSIVVCCVFLVLWMMSHLQIMGYKLVACCFSHGPARHSRLPVAAPSGWLAVPVLHRHPCT